MKLRWLCALLCLVASSVAAEIIPVQLGEGAGATRLVLTIPTETSWDITDTQNGLRVSVDGASGFETASFSSLTSESWISGVSGGLAPDTLNVGLRCDCSANSYVVAGKFLTIDLAPKERLPSPRNLATALDNLLQPWHDTAVALPADDLADTPLASPQIGARELDSEVSIGLAQAAYRGFVELREAASETGQSNVSLDVLENISVGINAQLQLTDGSNGDLPDPVQFDCSNVSAALNDAWTDDHSFNLQVGSAHRLVISDSESLDAPAMRDLAVVMIGHGFGREAAWIMREFGDQSDLAKLVNYIAAVIDGPAAPTSIGLESCDETLGFWAFLNDPTNDQTDIDPRRLMITYKLLPEMLQHRLVDPFSDALANAGHASFQAELQNYLNTVMSSAHSDPGSAPPRIELQNTAPARDILRADLTDADLDPTIITPRSPNTLPLSLLETLRLERRDTPGELVLLREVLARHVQEGNYIAVLNLLIDSERRLEPDVAMSLTDEYLAASVDAMADPELLAFAFRETLPDMQPVIAAAVRKRLETLGIDPPSAFRDVAFEVQKDRLDPNEGDATASQQLVLPLTTRAPTGAIPTFEQSEELLAGAAEMRNAIETFITDTNLSSN